MALLMTVMMLVMSAAPAMADPDKPKDPQPISPPGREIGQGYPSEQAADPQTGRANRFLHGSPQNGK
jgi:hypothetical protein